MGSLDPWHGCGDDDFYSRVEIAPLGLDMDLAQRAGMRGVQEWLSFSFKAPMHAPELYPEHDIFFQLMKLKNTLRHMQGEDRSAFRPGILRLALVLFEDGVCRVECTETKCIPASPRL